MRVGSREIGPSHDVYVIAELGVNHDGSAKRALELVDAAADAGADAIKTQWFIAERLMSRASRLAAYQLSAGERDPVNMLRRLELSADAMSSIVDRAHRRNLHAIVTVFSHELVKVADALPWDAYKTASPDIVHRPLIDALLATGRPIILSTGASTVEEVLRATDWARDARDRLAVLQCVSSYPTPSDQASLAAIGALREATDLPTGYSDHTQEVDTGAIAVACGACILEKHLTYDRAAKGPDHAASLDPDAFARYVRLARAARVDPPVISPHDPRLGPCEKRVLDCERDVRAVSRQSIVASRSLPAGHAISTDDLTIKRPGAGLPPWRLRETIGHRLARAVEADTPLSDEDLV